MSVTTDFPASGGSITTTTNTGDYWTYVTGNIYPEPIVKSIPSVWTEPIVYPTPYMGSYQEPNIKTNKKGGDDMRYLYEVILVNPKNDTFYVEQYIARSETSALMETYHNSQFYDSVPFDDLKTSCRVLMEWKKEKSLKKAIETIKKAVE